MDKAILVATDFAAGTKILSILDEAGLAISVAMWLYAPEYGEWRFVLSSRHLDEAKPAEAYGLVHNALDEAGLSFQETPPLMILRMADPFVKQLRRIFGKTKSVEGMRLGGQMTGNHFVEDALLYRIL